jgi:hypothetical protein
MAYKGSTVVSVEKFLAIAATVKAQVEMTTGYIVITKPGVPDKQVLVEKSLKKGATVATARWVELRGKGKVPYNSSTEGVVPHDHSSPSIKWRLNTDADEATILKNFSLLMNSLCDIQPVKEEIKEEEQIVQAA